MAQVAGSFYYKKGDFAINNAMTRLLFLLLTFSFLHAAFASGHQEEVSFFRKHTKSIVQNQPLITAYKTNVYYTATSVPAGDSTDLTHLKHKAKWAKWLGLGSLAGLIIPVIGIFSIPAAIASLILAGQVKRQTTDAAILKDAKTGKQTSTATLGIIAVSIVIAALIVAALLYRYR